MNVITPSILPELRSPRRSDKLKSPGGRSAVPAELPGPLPDRCAWRPGGLPATLFSPPLLLPAAAGSGRGSRDGVPGATQRAGLRGRRPPEAAAEPLLHAPEGLIASGAGVFAPLWPYSLSLGAGRAACPPGRAFARGGGDSKRS